MVILINVICVSSADTNGRRCIWNDISDLKDFPPTWWKIDYITNLPQVGADFASSVTPSVCAYLIAIGKQLLHYVMDGGAA